MIGIGEIMAGSPRIVQSSSPTPSSPMSNSLPSRESSVEVIARLTSRILAAEKKIELKVDGDGVIAAILMSGEDVVIRGDQVSVIGQVTFVDWIRDMNGDPDPGLNLDPKITRIIGDKIQTGVITSNNWSAAAGSKIDLDAGTIVLGGSGTPKFSVATDGALTCTSATIGGTLSANSIISNSCTVDGVSMFEIGYRAANGYNIQQALEVSGTTILKGVITPTDTGAVKVGSITWNPTTGALTGGTGVALTEYGIIGANSGSLTFSISATTGSATFSGQITGGSIVGETSIASGGPIYSTGTSGYAAIIPFGTNEMLASVAGANNYGYHDSTSFRCGVGGVATDGTYACAGVAGYSPSSLGIGTTGISSHAGGEGGRFFNSAGGLALKVIGTSTFDSQITSTLATGTSPFSITSTTVCANLNADMLDGYHSSSFLLSSGTAADSDKLDGYHATSFIRSVSELENSGSGIPSLVKPAGNPASAWYWGQCTANGVTFYIPYMR